MKLIVGLGNPGKEYVETRHNIGFIILDKYLGKVKWSKKFESCIYTTKINNEDVIFIKPQTYMNLSGISVRKAAKYYKINPQDILVIQDDLDLPVGSYKLKRNSSSGGHNGIKSIINELDTDSFLRIKVGIGKSENIPTDKYVLSKFSSKEIKAILDNYETFKNIIDLFINSDIENVFSILNKGVK